MWILGNDHEKFTQTASATLISPFYQINCNKSAKKINLASMDPNSYMIKFSQPKLHEMYRRELGTIRFVCGR